MREINVSLALDAKPGPSRRATITVSGPADDWFGVGFGALAMADAPWAVIVDGEGAVTERKLADHGEVTL